MRVALVQFTPWDKCYYFDARDFDLAAGDKVVVKTDLGTEMGTLINILDLTEDELGKMLFSKEETKDDKAANSPETVNGAGKENIDSGPTGGENAVSSELSSVKTEASAERTKELKPILRKATLVDMGKTTPRAEKERTIADCKTLVAKHNLPMKLVDVHFAFDGSRLTFAFIADGRVDFRDLVKDLTRYFNRTIRLQQIGIRDEARIMGDVGHCGRTLCCRGHLFELQSITSEMAELQQCAHRGSERISGVCGRLMCCLSYEQNGYENIAANLPAIGSVLKVDGKKGTVVGHHILKRTVDVRLIGDNGEEGMIVEVETDRKKK
jgi:cell fate regulator YaaT (PSP1 superfamily)